MNAIVSGLFSGVAVFISFMLFGITGAIATFITCVLLSLLLGSLKKND